MTGISGEFPSLGRHATTPTAVAFTSLDSVAAGGLESDLRFWHWGGAASAESS